MDPSNLLCNALHHSNEPNDVQRRFGEAALLWLNGILRKYEQGIQETDEIEDDDVGE